MVNQNQREKFQTLIRGTIISLCQNVLEHKSEVKIDVFVGITLDRTEDFHFSIVETLRSDDVSGSVPVEKPAETSRSSRSPSGNLHSGNMLEKLMVHDISSNRQGSISSSALPKVREVSSTTVNDRSQSSSLSYSELLRSFGELSRQDKPSVPINPSTSCPTLLNTLSSPPSSHLLDPSNANPINQAQVVIPINFAIHSPSTHGSRSSSSLNSKEHSLSDSRNYQWGMTPPSSSKLQRYDCEHPDTTYAMPDTHSCKTETDYNPYDVKVKQEVLSDEELEQEQQTEPEPYRYSRTSLNSNSCLGEEPPAKNSSTRPSPKGILMSLLCEKSPGVQGKKRGRAKKKSDDPLYIPPKQSKSDLSEMVPGTRENKDNRVLIGLTDYLSGFKEGDLSNEKLPRCVFSGPDISAKIRKVVLLNSGPFSTVRMVHRSLQGMRATEINEVMREMTKPRQHADYVGEYKAITMPKVRQWRRLVGVFYKCPPELLKPEALLSHDILLEDYKKFYEQMYKYDRTPKPPYFQAIEMFSPFSGTFSGKRGWREDPTFDPTTRLSEVYTANDLVECTPPEDEEIPASKSDEHPDGPSLQAMGIKSERVDWESADDDQNVASAAISTTQDSASKPVIGSPAQAEENLDSNVEQSAASRKFKASRESTPDDYNPNLVTFVPKNFGQQPVFPQPLIVSEYNNGHSENARELSDQPPSAISGGKQSCKEGRTLDRATELSEAHSASKMMNCSSERDREIAGSKSEEPSDGPRLQNVGIKSEMADRVSASDGNDDDHSLASTTVSTTQQTPTKLENGSPTFGDRDGHAERPAANNRDGHNLRSKKDGYISEPASQQL